MDAWPGRTGRGRATARSRRASRNSAAAQPEVRRNLHGAWLGASRWRSAARSRSRPEVRGQPRTSHEGTACPRAAQPIARTQQSARSEEHTSELQSLMRISYAVFCLKKKKQTKLQTTNK